VLTGASAVFGDAVWSVKEKSIEEIRSLVRCRWVGFRFRSLPRVEAVPAEAGDRLFQLSYAAYVPACANSFLSVSAD